MESLEARTWLAQAHWERGRHKDALELLSSCTCSEHKPVEYLWMIAHDEVTLENLRALFPDLLTLRSGRLLPVWKITVTVHDVPNLDKLGTAGVFLRQLADSKGVDPPDQNHAYLLELYRQSVGRANVGGEA